MHYSKLTTGLLPIILLCGCAQIGDEPATISMEEHSAETLRLKGRISDLEARLAASETANASLKKENDELSTRIEMLKVLDQAVEEKRKSLGSK